MPKDRPLLAYTVLAELVRRHQTSPFAEAPPDLSAYELGFASQNGEDGVLAEMLRRLGPGPGGRSFVEFGVETGREGNCVFLADVLAWSGLFLEADTERFNGLNFKYRGNPRVRTHRAFVGPDNADALFAELGVPSEPDILSIDIDGNDFWVWDAIASIRPRIVVVEYNSALHPRRRLVQPFVEDWEWDKTNYWGCSVGALAWLGAAKGYSLVHTELTGVNAFFVRDDLAHHFGAVGLDAVPLRSPNRFLSGTGQPPDPQKRTYLDLDREGEPAAPGGRPLRSFRRSEDE